eukprot:1157663-Alexandrium_andersonii.AAC.1
MSQCCNFGHPSARARQPFRNLREQRRRTHPSGASESSVEIVPGPAQFKPRTLGAPLYVPHGGLR